MRLNFIGKFFQKNQMSSSNSCIIFPQSQLQCDMLLLHSFDIIDLKTPRVGYKDFQLRDMWNCDAVTCHTVVYPTYHDHKRLAESI